MQGLREEHSLPYLAAVRSLVGSSIPKCPPHVPTLPSLQGPTQLP